MLFSKSNVRTVVLIPGAWCNARMWAHQIEALTPKSSVIVADLSVDDSIPAMASRILETCQSPMSVAGFSMGGYVVFELLRQASDRIDRFALISTTPDPVDEEREKIPMLDLVEACKSCDDPRALSEGLLPPYLAEKNLSSADISETICQMHRELGANVLERHANALIDRVSSWDELSSFEQPSLVLAGHEDQLIPFDLQKKMAEALPSAKFRVLKNTGHFLPLETPGLVNRELVNWLKN